ncbi:LysM peptidoglycan-binding domain-containing protein [Kocuria soli]|uniref:LysM peptidoglycan-binding domain-containing protein n=1 Tax=Kocuria soli TaxID=2485125 RepID=A0A3N3ZTA2_9MICC|nr:lytic transglycosylase domain-containing protein [Kocuria soli]ROZ64005.1 LysM peptidoglycan-binding domain-containing protein [Kocuria soli]
MHRTNEGQVPHDGTPAADTSSRPHKLAAARTATTMAALAALGLTGAPAAHGQPAAEHPTPTHDESRPDGPVRTVMPGDSLWSVATTNGISVEELMELNDLSGDAALTPGQHLRLSEPEAKSQRGEDRPPERVQADAAASPEPAGHSASPAPASPKGDAADSVRHEVTAGDSLWDLALRHDVTVAQIIETNDLDLSAGLRPGQVLQIPAAPATAAPVSRERSEPKAAPTDQGTAARTAHTDSQARTGKDDGGDADADEVRNNFPGYDYDDATVAAANRSLEQLRERPAVPAEDIQAMVRSTAQEMGVDPALALAHAQQESGFNHQVVSPANAIGTMQVVPSAGEWAESLVGRDLNLMDPQDNITAGVAIIRANSERADGQDEAIGAYYQGLHGVREYGMYSDTKDYVSDVKSKLKLWS